MIIYVPTGRIKGVLVESCGRVPGGTLDEARSYVESWLWEVGRVPVSTESVDEFINDCGLTVAEACLQSAVDQAVISYHNVRGHIPDNLSFSPIV